MSVGASTRAVPRIEPPTPDEFLRDWVLPQRPVILQGLFDNAPIRAIDDLVRARRSIGHVNLEIQPNYMIFLKGERGIRRQMKLAEYLDHVEACPRTTDLCVEFETPPALLDLFPSVPHASLRNTDDGVSATFLANAGNYNHLHYDDDQRDVLLYQVFGVKRFVLISPDQNRKLDNYVAFVPETRRAIASVPARDANGRVYFEEMPTEGIRSAFLDYLHAQETLLQPGETLFVPALYWHYVEYIDTSLSITRRLGRNRLNRELSAVFPFPDTFVQTIGSRLVDEGRFATDHPDLAAELDGALRAGYPTEDAREKGVYSVVRKTFEMITSDSTEAVSVTREMLRLALKGSQ